jgi:hypothetical protein
MFHIENIGCGPLPWGGIARYQEVGLRESISQKLLDNGQLGSNSGLLGSGRRTSRVDAFAPQFKRHFDRPLPCESTPEIMVQ